MDTQKILDELEVRMVEVQTLALLLPPPRKHKYPEERDRDDYDRSCAAALAWQARTIRELAAAVDRREGDADGH